jgi:hypothetical protein
MTSLALTKIVQVGEWHLVEEADAEPTIEDIELAAKLGFTRERKIRELIERLRAIGLLNDSDVRPTVGRQVAGGWGGHRKPVTSYRLSEAGALKVIAKSDTKRANEILQQVIDVYIAWRRGQLQPMTRLLAPAARVGDNAFLRSDMAAWCKAAARGAGTSVGRVHGVVRRHYLVPGVYHVPQDVWPMVREFLQGLALGRLLLPPAPKRLPPKNEKQLDMWRTN